MSSAACKIIIDNGAALIGTTLCLTGSAPVADAASGGDAVTPELAAEYEAACDQYLEVAERIIGKLDVAISSAGRPERGRPDRDGG